jgi:hypothetical protein
MILLNIEKIGKSPTRMSTTIVTEENLKDQMLKICELSLSDYEKYNNLLSENLIPLSKESYHFFTNILHPNNREEKVFYNLLFSAIFKAEKIAGGSSFLTFLASTNLYKTLSYSKPYLPVNHIELKKEWNASLERFKTLLEEFNRPILERQLEEFVMNNFSNRSLGVAVYEALKLAGIEGTILIEDGKVDKYVVEHREGFRFPLKTYSFFLQNQIETKLRDVRVLIVDGILETIGEIDQLLMKSQAEGCPMVIFAQGYSEEIIATLKHNIDLGRLRVFPVKIPTEIESLNLVNDIAYACNSNLVSSLAGQKVSMTKWEDLKVVDMISLTETEVSIVNPASLKAVSLRLKDMIEKRKNAVPDVQEFIDKRIKAFSPSSVVIRLPNTDKVSIESLRTEIDVQLRTIKSLRTWGVTDLSGASAKFKQAGNQTNMDRALQRVLMALEGYLGERSHELPLLNIFLALHFAGKQMIELYCSNTFVKLE